MYRPASPNSRY